MTEWKSYDAVAEIYERVRAPMTAVVAADLVALAAPAAGARVLDVGTGTGVAADAAGRATGDSNIAVGVDMAPEMLAVARRVRPGVLLAAAQAIQLPFRDAAFDVVLANFVLQEFKRYDTAMFDLLRVLKPGGRFAAATWLAEDDELQRAWLSLVDETVGKEMVRSARAEAVPWWGRFGSVDTLRDTFYDIGLRKIEIERRPYRFHLTREDYVAEQGTRALGRFVRGMLGERGWTSFEERARKTFAERYGDQVEDTRDVILVVATKP
ncbi:MAG: class I SAM-dependent methyltransferase [Actinomycetota bacterium]